MITNGLGINKQTTGENVDSWGVVLNENDDRYEVILKTLIAASAANKNVLHVLPTDGVGNPQITTYLKQSAEIGAPTYATIMAGLIASGDTSYPASPTGNNPQVFGTIAAAITYVSGVAGGTWTLIIHPGEHVVAADVTIPANCSLIGVSKTTCKITLSGAKLSIDGVDNTSIKGVWIDGTDYVLVDGSTTPVLNAEFNDCKFTAPLYIDCGNSVSPVDLFVKNSEIYGGLIFTNSDAGSNLICGGVAFMGCFISPTLVYVSDNVGDIGTAVSMKGQGGNTLPSLRSRIKSLTYELEKAATDATSFVNYQTLMSAFDESNYHIAGTDGSTSLASPYPSIGDNEYV